MEKWNPDVLFLPVSRITLCLKWSGVEVSSRPCSRQKPPLANMGEQWQALWGAQTWDSHSLGNPTRREGGWKVLVRTMSSDISSRCYRWLRWEVKSVLPQVCAPNWLQRFPRRECQCDSFFLISFHPKCSFFFKISCEDSSLQCDKFSNFVMEDKRKWNSLL